jgi:hypothetical protein
VFFLNNKSLVRGKKVGWRGIDTLDRRPIRKKNKKNTERSMLQVPRKHKNGFKIS